MKPGTDFLRNLAVACVPLLLAALGYLFTNALTLHDKVRVLEQLSIFRWIGYQLRKNFNFLKNILKLTDVILEFRLIV